MSRRRVVSLVPSITETLLAWDADVVACTRFCEQPNLPHVGGTKNPDIAAIVDLAPDVVLMDAEENRKEDHDALVAAGRRVVATHVRCLADVAPALDLIADAAGVGRPVPFTIGSIPGEPDGRTVLVPIWRRPWMAVTAATFGGDLLAHLGLRVVPVVDEPYPVIDLDRVRADIVLVPSEPYEFSDAHLDELRAAVPSAIVRRVDGKDLFWWGVRTASAIDRLRAEVP